MCSIYPTCCELRVKKDQTESATGQFRTSLDIYDLCTPGTCGAVYLFIY